MAARLSYGQQLRVLKKPVLWFSIAAVVFMNGAVFGVFGYFSGLSDQYHCFFVEYGKPDFTCLWFDEYRR